MSLDISLYNEEDEEVAAINWLRNPFGLERWAYWNTNLEYDQSKPSLYYVCNAWAYMDIDMGDPSLANRKLFFDVVDEHHRILSRKHSRNDEFYFAFENDHSLTTYVAAYREWFPNEPGSRGLKIEGALWLPDQNGNDRGTLLVPCRHFEEPHIARSIRLGLEYYPGMTIAQRYMAWYQELMDLATALVEHPEYRWYCSN